MIEDVAISPGHQLKDYAQYTHLASAVHELEREATSLVKALEGRTVWMVNSTAKGGGVAEMMPRQIALLNDLGVSARWVVIHTEREGYFDLTKRIHNLIHGEGSPEFSSDERELYRVVSEELAAELAPRLDPRDVLGRARPPARGHGSDLRDKKVCASAVWRCHIGLDEDNPQTEAAWALLEPFLRLYDYAVFTAPEYIPHFLKAQVEIITPAIDPLTDKNRTLPAMHLTGVLCNAGLMAQHNPVLSDAFAAPAARLDADGNFSSALTADEIGLMYRPIVTQISRWDRLKGFEPLLAAFVALKRGYGRIADLTPLQRRRFEMCRLVLAGPEPASVADDPEAKDVLDGLIRAWLAIEPDIRRDVRAALATNVIDAGKLVDGQCPPQLLQHRRPKFTARRFWSHRDRAHVETHPRARLTRLRHPTTDP